MGLLGQAMGLLGQAMGLLGQAMGLLGQAMGLLGQAMGLLGLQDTGVWSSMARFFLPYDPGQPAHYQPRFFLSMVLMIYQKLKCRPLHCGSPELRPAQKIGPQLARVRNNAKTRSLVQAWPDLNLFFTS